MSDTPEANARASLPFGLLLLAALVRLPGVLRDFPIGYADELNWIYGPIEGMLRGDPNPHWFEYPAGAVFTVSWLLGKLVASTFPDPSTFFTALHDRAWGFSVLFRLPIWAAGVLGVVALHRLARRLGDPEPVARAAALALALAVPFAQETRMTMLDVAAATLVLVAVRLALAVLDGTATTGQLVALGACIGTAANLKIPYALTAVCVPAALLLGSRAEDHVAHPRRRRLIGIPLAMLAGGATIAFIVYSWAIPPAVVQQYPLGAQSLMFLRKNMALVGLALAGGGLAALALPPVRGLVNFLVEARALKVAALAAGATFFAWSPFYLADVQKTLGDLMIVTRAVDPESLGPKPVTWHARILRRSGTELLGPALGVLGWCGIAWALARRDRRDLVALSVPVTWFAYTGLAAYSKLNLMHVFIPFLALYAARLVHAAGRPAAARAVWALALVPVLIGLAGETQRSYDMPESDTRVALRAWYRRTFPDGAPLALDPNVLLVDAKNPKVYQVPLARRDLSKLTDDGIRHVVTASWSAAWFALTAEELARLDAWLAAHGRRVLTISPDPPRVAGPELVVWEVGP